MNDNETITSRDNAKIKLARSVRDGRETGLIFVEGIRLVRELLASDLKVLHLFVSSALADSPKFSEIDELLHSKRPTIVKVAANVFSSIADTESPQGIAAIAQRPISKLGHLEDHRFGSEPIVLLHNVNNPANLGAVIRTAEAAGARAVITTNGSADAFSPKSIRASMGSCFRLSIIEGVEFHSAIEWANAHSLITTVADIGGSSSYSEIDWTFPRLLIFGSEAHGLTGEELGLIEETIIVPMDARVESLNLAVSSGIILFEAKRQRT